MNDFIIRFRGNPTPLYVCMISTVIFRLYFILLELLWYVLIIFTLGCFVISFVIQNSVWQPTLSDCQATQSSLISCQNNQGNNDIFFSINNIYAKHSIMPID